jgi:hypothetical protein
MPAMDWRTAYLTQAKSDYAMLLKLIREEAPLCHRLHYLQMTTEKMAKGFLTNKGGTRYAKTHDAFVKFVRLAGGRPEFRAASHFTQAGAFVAYVTSLLDTAQNVENLSPDGGDHANPEYPWKNREQSCCQPNMRSAILLWKIRRWSSCYSSLLIALPSPENGQTGTK